MRTPQSRGTARGHFAGFSLRIMQSIFSSAARRYRAEIQVRAGRRDGELKMDWTKPLPNSWIYGF